MHPTDQLFDEAGDMARVAEVAGHLLVIQPVHEVEGIGTGDLGAQGNERLTHVFTTLGCKNESLPWLRPRRFFR